MNDMRAMGRDLTRVGHWVSRQYTSAISWLNIGGSRSVPMGTDFGKLGTLIPNHGNQVVNWANTTTHGMQRMAERGVTQNMVNAWVKYGQSLQQAGDKIIYITQQGAVVVDSAGKVITAYTSNYFDENMIKIVEQLFGR